MQSYYEKLIEKGVFMRRARKPNPHIMVDEGVWVLVLKRDGTERCRFLVDERDYWELVRPYRWNVGSPTNNRVYTSAKIDGGSGNSTVLLSRWLTNPPADKEVDHENKNPLDNRQANLRVVTRKQNEENGSSVVRGRSKHRGVHFDKFTGRWRAEVTHNYEKHKSPRFKTEDEANEWAIAKRQELYTHGSD